MPSPDEKPVEICEDEKGELIEINCTPNGSTCAFVLRRSRTSTAASYFKGHVRRGQAGHGAGQQARGRK